MFVKLTCVCSFGTGKKRDNSSIRQSIIISKFCIYLKSQKFFSGNLP